MLPLQKHLIAISLKQIIDESILTNQGRYIKNANILNKKESIFIRFKSKLHESMYKQLDPFQLESEKLNEVRLDWQISSIITILSKTVAEILEDSDFKFLLETICRQKDETVEEENLKIEHKLNKEKIEELKAKLKNHVSNAEVKIHCRSEILATLKTELSNIKRINNMELNLVTNWEQTRYEQAKILDRNRAREKLEILKSFEYKIDKETEVMHHIENLYQKKIQYLAKQIKYWNEKYLNELKKWDDKIQFTEEKIKSINDNREKHIQVHQQQQNFIDEYLAKKAEEQKLHDLQMKRINSAIKIQAWWRGTMVRKGLGPYRKKKKGKKSKKGK